MKEDRFSGLVIMSLLVVIWATNLVSTRYSILGGFSAFDLVALRYSVAAVVLLPNFLRLGPGDLGGLGWSRGICLTCLAGAPYMAVFFTALGLAPASHAAVLNPGIVPSVVFLGSVFLGERRFSLVTSLSLALIIVGLVLVTASSFSMKGEILLGDTLYVLAGISWGLFTLLAKRWDVGPMQSATIISVISSVWLVPYLLFFYEGFPPVSVRHFLLQAFFQGIVVSIGTFYMVVYGVRSLGAQQRLPVYPLGPLVGHLDGRAVSRRDTDSCPNGWASSSSSRGIVECRQVYVTYLVHCKASGGGSLCKRTTGRIGEAYPGQPTKTATKVPIPRPRRL